MYRILDVACFCRNRTSCTMAGFCHLFLLIILLMRSGDVEINPGPNNPESNVSEKEYFQLSQDIGASNYDKLGVNLEVPFAQLDDIKERSSTNSNALMRVFMKWRLKQNSDTNIRAVLAEKLRESGLSKIAGKLLDGSLIPNVTPTSQPSLTPESQTNQPLSPELIQRCAEDFKFKYRTTLCKIRADPLDPESLVQFQDIYTNLVLEEEEHRRDTHGKMKRKPLEYGDLLNLRVNEEFPRRLLVQGEAGAGKTTLCAKIAWDWIDRKYFKEFVWVIIVPLRESQHYTIGEIAKSYLRDGNPATPSQLTEYIRSNEDKVYLVFDGLDESTSSITQAIDDKSPQSAHHSNPLDQSSDSGIPSQLQCTQQSNTDPDRRQTVSLDGKGIEVVDILRSRKLEACPVLVTTRPWKAKEIRQNDKLKSLYTFISVEGFNKENLAVYIHKYFADDQAKANDLIHFAGDNDIISENMAPYPIFVAMLCLMWRESGEEKTVKLKSLQTFSQIFKEMFCFLKEHYALKISNPSCSLDESLNDCLRKVNKLLEPVANLAFTGLLGNTLVFSEHDFQNCPESMLTACKVGVLSEENKLISRKRRHDASSLRRPSTFFFPHKLFQEFMAGVHLASLYETDDSEYDKLMKEVVVPRKEEFRYLLYFTASQNAAVGISVLNYFVHHPEEFLVDVAFECHDRNAIAVMKNTFSPEGKNLRIYATMTAHTLAGYTFVGIDMEHLIVNRWCGPAVSGEVAVMMCSSPSLKKVTLRGALHDKFYTRLAAQGHLSKVQELVFTASVGNRAQASSDLASALCSMLHLIELRLGSMEKLHERFYSTLEVMASSLKVHAVTLMESQAVKPIILRVRGLFPKPSPSACHGLASALCTMPNLRVLTLECVTSLCEEFYSTLGEKASSIKVQEVIFKGNKHLFRLLWSAKNPQLSPSASRDLASALCTMSNLRELQMEHIFFGDVFYSTLREKASSIKVQEVILIKYRPESSPQWSANDPQLSPSSSRDLASALCTMSNLRVLTLKWIYLGDVFYSTLREKASSIKVQTLTLSGQHISPEASGDLAEALCSMPNLTKLCVTPNFINEEFVSAMKTGLSILVQVLCSELDGVINFTEERDALQVFIQRLVSKGITVESSPPGLL